MRPGLIIGWPHGHAQSTYPVLPRNALGKVMKPQVAKLFRAPPRCG